VSTPKTDAIVSELVTFPQPETILDFARELEREIQDDECELDRAWSLVETLQKDNAKLRARLEEWEEVSEMGPAWVSSSLTECAHQLARADKAKAENAKLRDALANLCGQTRWVCQCGGTDCEGQSNNAKLLTLLKQSLEWLDDYDLRLSGSAGLADKIRSALEQNKEV